MGSLLIFVYLALFPNWSRFFAVDGMTAGLPPDTWNVFYWTDGFVDPVVFWWLGFAASIAFLLGYQTRIAAILLFVLQVSMIHRNRGRERGGSGSQGLAPLRLLRSDGSRARYGGDLT
jgi:uncharacterized membrane protein YphA (DoxX/SURF4 family)